MIDYTKTQLARLLKIDFVRFCIVGGSGFFINLAILTGTHRLFNFPIPLAQFIGAEIALFSNFLLHDRWTYKKHKVDKTKKTLIIQFHASTWPAIIGSTLMVSAGVKVFDLTEIEALIISSVVALGWNFVWSKYVIWRDVKVENLEEVIK